MIHVAPTVNTQIKGMFGSTPRKGTQENCDFYEIPSMNSLYQFATCFNGLSVSPVPLLVYLSLNNGGSDCNYNFTVCTIVVVYIYCQLGCLQVFGMHFQSDNDTWYFNQEMKMISTSMAIIIQFDLYTIGYVAKFNLCLDNNFYNIGAHIIWIQYADIVFFMPSVIIPIYKNVNLSSQILIKITTTPAI